LRRGFVLLPRDSADEQREKEFRHRHPQDPLGRRARSRSDAARNFPNRNSFATTVPSPTVAVGNPENVRVKQTVDLPDLTFIQRKRHAASPLRGVKDFYLLLNQKTVDHSSGLG
jgi:hypothetical protein